MADIPEYYSDALNISLAMPWTVALTFSIRSTKPDTDPESQVIVRMSPEHAKITAMLLRKNLKQYEDQAKTSISLPGDVYEKLKLDSLDW